MSLGKLKVKPGLKASLLQKDTKKSRLALGEDEPEDSIKQQEILGWDAAEGGALEVGSKKKEEGLRIILAQPSRDWRAEARRKILSKAPHQQVQEQKSNVDDKEKEETKIQYGLTIIQKDEPQDIEAVQASEPIEVVKDTLTEEQRLEKQALDALLTGKSADEDLVIPVQTEEEAFLNDLHNAPEAPTLEAYEAQPIEGFGAALLRGMGWKDGEAFGKNGKTTKAKEVKRRPALLGIGAKEEAAAGVELGAWGPKSGNGKKVVQSYNPVALRNKRTGEIITEEELKAKLDTQDMVPEEKPSKSRSKYSGVDDEDEDDERRREHRRDRVDDRRDGRDRNRRCEDDHDSERRRDRDTKSYRRRERNDYNDSDRRRDKRRSRDDEHNSERRRDRRRERSRSPDDRAERRRDRYRSRSRDMEDQRDRRKQRDRGDRSRSRDSDDRRKRRRDREYEDEREDRKRRQKDERCYR